jgi:hypothetical protein
MYPSSTRPDSCVRRDRPKTTDATVMFEGDVPDATVQGVGSDTLPWGEDRIINRSSHPPSQFQISRWHCDIPQTGRNITTGHRWRLVHPQFCSYWCLAVTSLGSSSTLYTTVGGAVGISACAVSTLFFVWGYYLRTRLSGHAHPPFLLPPPLPTSFPVLGGSSELKTTTVQDFVR